MNDAADPSTSILFLVGVVVVVIAIQVAIIRWIFRINEIVALLKDILAAIRPQNFISADIPPLQLCDGCGLNFEKNRLKKITSGQMLCPECINNLKSKKAKKV